MDPPSPPPPLPVLLPSGTTFELATFFEHASWYHPLQIVVVPVVPAAPVEATLRIVFDGPSSQLGVDRDEGEVWLVVMIQC